MPCSDLKAKVEFKPTFAYVVKTNSVFLMTNADMVYNVPSNQKSGKQFYFRKKNLSFKFKCSTNNMNFYLVIPWMLIQLKTTKSNNNTM